MKPSSFITLYNSRVKNKSLDKDIIVQTITDLIKPVDYIPYDDKIKLVVTTITQSYNSEYPTAILHRNFIINMISAYTNLEMDNDGFDLLSKTKMIDLILSLFQSEFTICDSILNMCLNDIGRKVT